MPIGTRFDIFKLVWPKETDVSRILADLLDPYGSHGLGSKPLEDFLGLIRAALPQTVQPLQWLDRRFWRGAQLEEATPSARRIDLVLRFNQGIVGFENKPWTVDQDKQLQDYAEHLRSQAPENWLLIYLSNREPSQESMAVAEVTALRAQGRFLRLSLFAFASWIERCGRASLSDATASVLESLANYLRTSVNFQSMSALRPPELLDLVKSPGNLQAAFAIAEAVSFMKRDLLERLRESLELEASTRGWSIPRWDLNLSQTKKYTGFMLVSPRLQGSELWFEWPPTTRLQDFHWGLYQPTAGLRIDAEGLSEALGASEIPDRNWPWWQRGSQAFPMPESDVDAWRYLESGAFAKDIASKVDAAIAALGAARLQLPNAVTS